METPSSVSSENAGGPFSFKVGEEGFGFDGGFTEGKFTGLIRGIDGKEFAGLVEDLGGGRYRIEDYEGGRIIEPPAQAGPVAAEALAAVPAEALVGGLEDAAAVVAAGPVAPAEVVAPAPKPAAASVVEEVEDLMVEPEPQPAFALGLAPEPAPESTAAPMPEITTVPPETGGKPTVAEARKQFDQEFRDTDDRARLARYDADQKNSLQRQAQELRSEAKKARKSVDRLRNKDRIAEAFSEEGKLVAEAKRLESQAAKIYVLEPDQIRAIEERRQRTMDLMQEIDRWGNLMENPAVIEEHRGLDGRMREDLAAAEKLFGGGNLEDQRVLDAARKRIEGRTQARRIELEAMFPRRFMELVGMAQRQDLGDAATDNTLDRDLIEKYYQFADQFYAELTGQPAAAEIPQPEVEPQPTPESVGPPVVEQPVEVVVGQPKEVSPPPVEVVVDEEERARAKAAKPVETTIEWINRLSKEVIINQGADGKVKVEFTGGGWIEDDNLNMLLGVLESELKKGEADPDSLEHNLTTEQLRFAIMRLGDIQEKLDEDRTGQPAAMAAGMAEASVPGEQERFEAATLDAARQQAAEAAAEAPAETPEQRFERRKQGFAGALAGLDRARSDTSGTEGEQKVRLAEAYNQAIGAAMELMEEGETAKEVVKGFFAGALGTSGGRKLTEVAVRSRMDEAGVLQAATAEERKKKLEEAGLWGLLTLLLELGMSFTDKSVEAVVNGVQSATGAGR